MQTVIQRAFAAAATRLLLLDYDGTLREFETDPQASVPTPEIRALLEQLSHLPGTTVVVISGRGQGTMQAWFGDLLIWLVAEHGYYLREPGGDWQTAMPLDTSWKPPIRTVLEEYMAQVPLSSIEEKHSALAWHYRASDHALGEATAAKALVALRAVAANHPVEIVRGNCVIEVHVPGIHKGVAARRWLDKSWGFILVAGDDTTDEDMFRAAPESAFTIKVGPGETLARQYIASPAAMRELLASL